MQPPLVLGEHRVASSAYRRLTVPEACAAGQGQRHECVLLRRACGRNIRQQVPMQERLRYVFRSVTVCNKEAWLTNSSYFIRKHLDMGTYRCSRDGR